METNKQNKILDNIGKIYEKAKDCKLENAFFENHKKELKTLAEYFQVSENQALFVSVVFGLAYQWDRVTIKEFTNYFSCNPMKILAFNNDLEELYAKGILEKQKVKRMGRWSKAENQIHVQEGIVEAILQGESVSRIKKKELNDDVTELLEKLDKLVEERDDDELSTSELFHKTDELLAANSHFPLVEKTKQFGFETANRLLYLYVVWKTITGNESIDISMALERIYDRAPVRFRRLQEFLSGKNILVKNNLIETVEASFFNNTEMKLSPASFDLLEDCDLKLFINKTKKDNLILPSETVERKLIFDPEKMKQLNSLEGFLEENNYKEIQQKLSKKGLPNGVAVLLHGAPGTGKTEIVKQLAKKTGREIMKVDMSQTKSMWFGETEKIVKRIFTDYRAFAKTCERAPVLFFNEADAIISKRKEIGRSNVAQTENAIQNILLEELENLDGILIATTNLAENLDTAFERRFLFKIHFQNPSISVRAKIWKSKLPLLKEKECLVLSQRFEFSGGQIENILRKNEIQEIIYGKKTNFENLLLFCEEESIGKKRIKIGFGNV